MNTMMTASEYTHIATWFADAKPGAVWVYWTGHLAKDCGAALNDASASDDVREARTARGEAFALARAGLVDLVQRRLGKNECEYLAIKRRHRDPHPVTPYFDENKRRDNARARAKAAA